MRILKFIILGLFIGVGGLLLFTATRPDSFSVDRAIDIKASAAKIFPYLNDFHKSLAWSPWEAADAQMKREYNAISAGKGAAYAWHGNRDAGKGRMEILESRINERVVIALHFDQPMATDNRVEYVLTAKGEYTNVKWSMRGPMPFIARFAALFMDMDKMVGGQFEKGLQRLKEISEK